VLPLLQYISAILRVFLTITMHVGEISIISIIIIVTREGDSQLIVTLLDNVMTLYKYHPHTQILV
jgi:hypothetical protein